MIHRISADVSYYITSLQIARVAPTKDAGKDQIFSPNSMKQRRRRRSCCSHQMARQVLPHLVFVLDPDVDV